MSIPPISRFCRLCRHPSFTALLLFCHLAHAQLANPADEFLRQQERERQLRQQQEKSPDVRLPAEPRLASQRLPGNETPCFPIRQIVLAGDAARHFDWAVAHADVLENGEPDPALNRCLGSAGINLVMRRIQNAIVARGFVTSRVLAEPQDLNSGTLRLTLIPGRIRNIRFTPGPDSCVPERATLANAMPAVPGDLLKLRDIEQALENLKRVPSAEADGFKSPDTVAGFTLNWSL